MWKTLIVPAIASPSRIANWWKPSAARAAIRSRCVYAVKNPGDRTGSNGARKSRFAR